VSSPGIAASHCERFRTAPLKALSPTGLLAATVRTPDHFQKNVTFTDYVPELGQIFARYHT
jgi:hypothetical protein